MSVLELQWVSKLRVSQRCSTIPPFPPTLPTPQVACILGAALVLFTSRSEGEGGGSYDAF